MLLRTDCEIGLANQLRGINITRSGSTLFNFTQLLAKNSDNVSQIAYSVGFSSLSYFNKCFKEQFGMTPGQFAAYKVRK